VRSGPKPRSVLERFNEKYSVDPSTGCWNWVGIVGRNGYGRIYIGRTGIDRQNIRANRLAWQLFRGPIPDGQCVLHKCDNRKCVNPDHLWLGTRAENMADMIAKGRQRWLPCGHPVTDQEWLALGQAFERLANVRR
jgi:hypothetical protein